MTYESLLSGLTEISDWFVLLVTRCLDFISQYPLAMLAVIVVVVFPFVPFIFSFIQDFADSSEGMANSVIDSYKLFKLHKKKKEEKKHREAFLKEKQNKQVRAYQIAQEFFENNPHIMSISVMGHKFFQKDFEKKHWGGKRYYSPITKGNPSTSSTRYNSAKIEVEKDDD